MKIPIVRDEQKVVGNRGVSTVHSVTSGCPDMLFRQLTNDDNGIDSMIEIYNNGKITGKFVLVQIKAKRELIIPLKNTNETSCTLNHTILQYCQQRTTPVIIAYCSWATPNLFYYMFMDETVMSQSNVKNVLSGHSLQKTATIRIPFDNKMERDDDSSYKKFLDKVNQY